MGGILWKRMESKSMPGSFYYLNPATNTCEVNPPTVKPPWLLFESKTKQGQYYYFHEDTKETIVDPPVSAVTAVAPPPAAPVKPAQQTVNPLVSRQALFPEAEGELPPGWRKASSSSNPGKLYYVQDSTGTTVWDRPSVWEKKNSSSHPGKFYFVNAITGETKWQA